MTSSGDRTAVRHVEVFASRRTGVNVQVPCWCFIGEDHEYDAWRGVAASDGAAREGEPADPPAPSGSAPLAP